MGLLPFRRKSYSGFLRSEKIYQPWPGLNPQTLDPLASMITMGPPGSTSVNGNYSVFLLLRRVIYKLSNEAGNGKVTNPKQAVRERDRTSPTEFHKLQVCLC